MCAGGARIPAPMPRPNEPCSRPVCRSSCAASTLRRSAHLHRSFTDAARFRTNKSREGFVVGITNQRAMSEMTEIALPETSESSKVESWRLHVLIEAGYPLSLAERLAVSEADLHLAVELVRSRRCAHETAAEILL